MTLAGSHPVSAGTRHSLPLQTTRSTGRVVLIVRKFLIAVNGKFIPSLKISRTGHLPVFAVRRNKCSLLPQHHSALFQFVVVSSALFWISPSSCSAVQWLRSCSISGTSPGGFQFVTSHLKSVLPNLYQNSKYGPPLRVEEFLSS